MPELPEVETVCRGIAAHIKNSSIKSIKVFNPKLRIPIPKDLAKNLVNTKVKQIKRKAKYILIYLDNQRILVIHLGMSGRLQIIGDKQERIFYHQESKHKKHDHLLVEFSNGTIMVYNDTRKFGLVTMVEAHKLKSHKLFKSLGAEPLSKDFNDEEFYQLIKTRNKSIKSVIMDASIIVGVGNIYASESLFRAGIKPTRLANSLTKQEASKLQKAIVATLEQAIDSGGSTLKDYAQANGASGYFQHKFLVYGKAGKPCKRCSGVISKIIQNGRSSFYCESCQK